MSASPTDPTGPTRPPGSTPVLHLVAGPNGAGKTTFVTRVLQPITHLAFVNADTIAAERWPDTPAEHAYDASRTAAAERQQLLSQRASFISETVFSHASKNALIEEATRLGYLVTLHVVMVPEDTAVARVEHRVRHGGHAVPEHKTRERYTRLWALIVRARAVADRTVFYDNTSARTPFRKVAVYERGQQTHDPDWPDWAPAVLAGD